MSLRKFIQRTQLLLDQALHESRQAIHSDDACALRSADVAQLEERILMSASPAAVVAEAPAAEVAPVDSGEATAVETAPDSSSADQQVLDVVADEVLPEAVSVRDVTAEQTLELVFIDGSVSNLNQMVADLESENASDDSRTLEIVVLDSSRDGIAQITSALIQYDGIDGIHIVSHGEAGRVQLGSTTLSLDTLPRYRNAINAWQHSMSDQADLLFYGCNLAATDDGRELMNQIAAECDCDVSASEDLTGHEDLGGDWDLEYAVGDVSTEIAFGLSVQGSWRFTLDTTSNLIAHYEFDNDALSVANDSSGSGKHGVYQNSENTTAGQIGTLAADFTGDGAGTNQHITVADDPSLDFGTDDFSVAFWINSSDTTGHDRTVLARQDGDGFRVYTETGGILKVNLSDGGSNGTYNFGAIADGSWHHVAFTRSGGTVATYVDGGLVGSNSATTLNLSTVADLVIGADDDTTNDFEGLLDDVRIYNRQLSGSDVAELAIVSQTITVDTTTDYAGSHGDYGDTSSITALLADKGNDGFISLREAVDAVNNTAGAHTIELFAGTYSLSAIGDFEEFAQTGDIDILGNVTIVGSGAGTTIIDANALDDRIFEVFGTGSLTLRDLTLTGASAGTEQGGAVSNVGVFNATDVVFSDNTVANVDGAAVYSEGTTNLNRVAIVDNVSGGNGAGVAVIAGTTTLTNATISGNSADYDGGGVTVDGGALIVDHVTIADNQSVFGRGGGLRINTGTASVSNSIVADNTAAFAGFNLDVDGPISSGGRNIIGDTEAVAGTVGTDQTGVDPQLTALLPVSGTFVHLFDPSSVAIDGAIESNQSFDQTGATRTGIRDIGAYEVQDVASDIQGVSTTNGGLSLNHDGGNDAFLHAEDTAFWTGDRLTMEFQISDLQNTGTASTLFSTTDAMGTVELRILSDGRLSFFGIDSSVASLELFDGEDHSVAFTWNGSSGALRYYVDGAFIEQVAGPVGSLISTNFVLGQDQDALGGPYDPSETFSGTYRDVRIFSAVRTDTQIQSTYRSTLPHDEPDMSVNWRFDQVTSDGTVIDAVAGRNLTAKKIGVGGGFTSSNPEMVFTVDENSTTGTVVGSLEGIDAERQALINSLLAADTDLVYSAETGKFYKHIDVTTDWSTALATATGSSLNGISGQLVTIRSAFENQLIWDMAITATDNIWLGASDQNVEGDYYWYEGSSEADLFWIGDDTGFAVDGAYTNWNPSDPNNLASHHYGFLSDADGTWWDNSDTSWANTVVEWNANEVLDASQSLTYSIVSQSVAGSFAIDADNGQITVADGSLLDYETNATHTITVRSTDVDSNTFDKDFTIALNDLVEPSGTPTDISSGIEFNTNGGNDAYLIDAVSGAPYWDGFEAITMEFQISELGVPDTIATLYSRQSAGSGSFFGIEADGTLNWTGFTSANTYTELFDGSLHNVGFSWDAPNGDLRFYVDGEIVEQVATPTQAQTNGGGAFVLGQDQDSTGADFDATEAFSGVMHDVRIWDHLRSIEEIARTYQQKVDVTPVEAAEIGLVANWQMEFNGSNEVVDIVNGYTLSIGHATEPGFIDGNIQNDLHVTENALNGTTVGYLTPVDPETHNDLVADGLFLRPPEPAGFTRYTSGQTFGGWSVESGNVDLVGSAIAVSPLNGRSVELNGDTAGAITQTLTTEVGRQYQVHFVAAGNFQASQPHVQFQVDAGGISHDYTIAQPAGWSTSTPYPQPYSFTFTADSTTTELRFTSLESGPFGAVVADVQVLEVPVAVNTILNNDSTLSYDAATAKFYRFAGSNQDYATALGTATAATINGVSGQLATVRSAYENDVITNIGRANGVAEIWLSGTDTASEGVWRWADGEQFSSGATSFAGSYVNWSSGEPNDGGIGEDHVMVFVNSGEWNDVVSNANLSVVVEWDASEVLSNYSFAFTAGGNAGGRFAIDGNTGEITVANGSLLDYEVATSHVVFIEATDAAGNVATFSETIAVDDGAGDASLTVPIAQSTDEDVRLTFSTGAGNAISVGSGSPDDPQMTLDLSVANGTLSLASTAGISFHDGTTDGTNHLLISGNESALNTALDGLQYTPTLDYSGSDTLQVSTGSAAPANANLFARYEFEDGSTADSSGNGRDGTISGDPVLTQDAERGDVMTFDGDDFITVTNGTSGLLEEVSIAAWVKLDAGQQENVFLSVGDEVYVILDPTNLSYGIGGRVGTFTSYSLDSGDRVGGDGWHHVALTFDDVNNVLSVYLDGELTRSSSNPMLDATWGDISTDIIIGGLSDGSRGFVGSIDDARVYDRALTADEIVAIMGDQGQASETVGITVDPVNDAPTFTTLPPITSALIDSAFDPQLVEAGDFDNDGHQDLIAATSTGEILLYRNLGSGQYEAGTTLFNTAGYDFTSISTADINGDGDLDFVITNMTPDASENGVLIFQNQFVDSGSTTFSLTPMEIDFFDAFDSAIADIDGDGRQDIVVSFNSGDVVLYEQNTANVFTRSLVGTVTAAKGVDVDDIDGDGSLDIAVAGSSLIVWFENDSTADPGFTSFIAGAVINAADVVIADFDSDSNLDIGYVSDFFFGGSVGWLESNGAATPSFTGHQIDGLINFSTVSKLIADDIDSNGTTDLILSIASADEVRVYDNDGSGTFTQDAQVFAPDEAAWIDVADIDGDGDRDLLYAEVAGSQFGAQINRGGGVFSTLYVNKDTTLTGLQVQVDDVDAGSNDLEVTLTVTSGTVTIPTGSVTFSGGINSGGTVTFTGTIAEINTALNSFSFTPTSGYVGDAAIQVDVDDQGNTGSGGAKLSSETLLLNVRPNNNAPVMTPYGPTYNTTEDSAPFSATVAAMLSSSVSDPDSGAVEGIAVYSSTGSVGTLEYSVDGGTNWFTFGALSPTNATLLRSSDLFRYTPDGISGGTMTLDYYAWDQTSGTAGASVDVTSRGGSTAFSATNDTVTINATDINDAPSGTDNTIAISEDATYALTAADFGFSDVDGDSFDRVWIMTLPGAGLLEYNGSAFAAGNWISKADLDLGLLTFEPAPGENGTSYASFQFQVQDDGGTANGGVNRDSTSNTITFDVAAQNDDPVVDHGGPYVISEGGSLSLDASGTTDVDSGTLTYRWDLNNDATYDVTTTSSTVTPTWSALTSHGIDDDGVYTIGLQVDDGDGGVVTTATTVTVTNVAPTLTATGAATAGGGATYTLTLSDVDPGDDTISQWIVNWGDGSIDTYVGDPGTVTHTYSNDVSGMTLDITVSVIDEDGQHFESDLLVPAYGGDYVSRFDGNDADSLGTFAPSSDGISGHANIAIMPSGNYLVSGVDSGNVLEYQPDGTFVGEFIATGTGGLSNPGGLVYGPDGNIYIADFGDSEILRFDGATGAFIDAFVPGGTPGMTSPLGLQFGPDGDLYVSSRGSAGVLKFDGSTGALDVGFNVTSISGAEDLTFGPDGNIYVGSSSGVLRVDAASGAITTFVANGSGGLTLAAGVDFGPDGNLYVADQSSGVIRRYNGTTGAYLDDYATGIAGPAYLEFTPDHRVTVTHSNQSPTVATNTGATVLEGSSGNVITAAMLNEGDPDDDGAELTYTITSHVNTGLLQLSGATIGLSDTFTQADIDAGLVTYNHDGSETIADSFGFSLADGGEGGSTPATGTFTFTITPVNDAPVADANGADGAGINYSTSFTEGGAAVSVVDSDATISDVDNAFYDGIGINLGGFTDGLVEEIRINGVLFQAGVSVVQSTTINSTTFELDFDGSGFTITESGGDGLIPQADLQLLLRTITYEHTGLNPTAGNRSFAIIPQDSDGLNAAPVAVSTVSVNGTNNAPTISNLDGDSLSYSEGDGAVTVEQGGNAIVADADSTNFDGGTLTVSISAGGDAAEDILAIRNQGAGAGQIGISGSHVTFSGTVVGTFTGGSSGTDLVVTFNANASSVAVTMVLQNVTYENTDTANPTSGARTVDFVVTDGDGGTSATHSTSVTVNGTNDAPVLDNSGSPALPDITEDDVDNAGMTVAALLATGAGGDPVSDVDANPEGIAITARNNGRGVWQYSTDGGSNWSNVGTVSESSALLLRSTDLVRFNPDGNNGGVTPTFDFRAWDRSSGTEGTKVDTTTNGGTTAFSTAIDTASTTSLDVNDAPVLDNSGVVSLTSQNEDSGVPVGVVGTVITDLVSIGGNVTDVDASSQTGIAITAADTTNGTWWYTIDGGTNWNALGAVSDSSARVLNASSITRLYFEPNANFNGTVSNAITFRAWDRSLGSNGTLQDASTNGGSSAFSAVTETASLTIAAEDDAPTISSIGNQTITEDSSTGALAFTVADAETAAGSLVVTAVSSDQTVIPDANLLLADLGSGNWTIEAVPAADQNGGPVTITVTVDDGTTTTDTTFDVTVTAINDAPVLDNSGDMSLTNIVVDSTDPSGDSIASILLSAVGQRLTDADAGAAQGIGVIGVDDTNGTWQFSTNGGSSWTSFASQAVPSGSTDATNAVLLDDTALIRFVPNAAFIGNAGTLTFVGWDQTDGNSSGDVGIDVSAGGAAAAYSVASETATLNVTGAGLTAIDDAVTTNVDTSVVIDVVDNDFDPEGDALTVIDFTQAANGTVTQTGAGEFTYTPDAGYTGSDSFEYVVNDGTDGLSSFWNFQNDTSDVISSNDGTNNGASVAAGQFGNGLQFNDAEQDYVEVTDFTVNDEFTLSFWFKVDDNSGAAFQYMLSYGGLDAANSLQIGLVENSTPGFQNPPGTLRTALRDANDSSDPLALDVDASSLIGDGEWHLYTLTTESGVGSKVYIDGVLEASDWRGGDTFDPTTNLFFGARYDLETERFFNGSLDGIRLYDQTLDASSVADLYDKDDATGTVNVTVNDHPVLTMTPGGDSYTENGAAGTYVDAGVTITDSDVVDFDGGVLTTTVTGNGTANDRLVVRHEGVGFGQVNVIGSSVQIDGVAIASISGGNGAADPLSISFNSNADAADVQQVARRIAFLNTSDDPSILQRTISMQITDGDGGISGIGSRTMDVVSVNDAPTLTTFGSVVGTTAEDTELEISFAELLAVGNEFDVDGTVTGFVVKSVSSGSLRIGTNVGAATAWAAGTNDTITAGVSAFWTPAAEANGTLNAFDVVALDDLGTESIGNVVVQVDVTPVNDAPTGTPVITGTAAEDQVLTADTSGISDADGVGPFSYQWTRNGTAIVGANSATYTLTDADVGTNIAVEVSYTDGFGTNEGPLTSAAVGPIANVNDTPTITAIADQTINEDASTGPLSFSVNDIDNAVGTLTVMAVSSNQSVIPDANLTLTTLGSGSWTISATPNGDQNGGPITITVSVNDGTTTTSTTFDVTVNAVNDAPVVNVPPTQTIVEDTQTLMAGISIADIDDAGMPMAVHLDVSNGILVLDLSGGATVMSGANNSAIVRLTGTKAQLNAALASLEYRPGQDVEGIAADTLTVLVSDLGNSGSGGTLTDSKTVQIDITNVNDEEVLVANAGLFVSEGQTATVIDQGALEATDVENTPDFVVYNLNSVPVTGTLRLNGTPLAGLDTFSQQDINDGLLTYDHNDAEVFVDGFDFTVDDGTGSSTSGTFDITITPVNDNDPVITSHGGAANVTLTIDENATSVTTVSAEDSDLPSQTLTYSIIGGSDAARFSIDSATGELSFATAPDFEAATDAGTDNGYDVVVGVDDGLGRTDQQTFHIDVQDVDEFNVTPIADTNATTDAVTENTAVGTAVGITALSADFDGTTNAVSYTLDDDAGGLFAIDSSTGVVTTAAAIDFESTGPTLNISVRATSEDGSSATQSYAIAVNDQNDNAPVISSGQAFSVNEFATVGTSVGTALATDVDSVGTLQNWTIAAGNSDAIFAIDPATGEIYVADTTNLNFETGSNYLLTLTVDDGVNASSTQTVQVDVINQNDAPVFTPAGPFSVDENSANGTSIGSVLAADEDASDVLSYRILGGTRAFTISAGSGQIFVADVNQLDFETTTSFTLTVEVEDAGGLTDSQVTTINVNDLNEHPVSLALSGGVVAENSANGTIVGSVVGTDVDAGDSLTYSLISSGGGRFTVDAFTGIVSVADGTRLDFETDANHTVILRATDSGGLSYDESFTFTVTDLNEAPVAGDDAFSGDQLEDLVVAAGEVVANDLDVDGDAISVLLISGPQNGVITLNPDGSFVYSPESSFSGLDSFTYVLTDGVLFSEEATVVIEIRTTISGGGSSGNSGTTEVVDPIPQPPTTATSEAEPEVETESQENDTEPTEESETSSAVVQASNDGSGDGEEIELAGTGNDVTQQILRSTNSEQFVAIFLDDVPDSETLDSNGSRGRQERSESGRDDLSYSGSFLFEPVSVEQPFLSRMNLELKDQPFGAEAEEQQLNEFVLEKVVVGSTAAVSTSVSVGYVVWMLRGGSLLTTFLSSLPAWQAFDPLPVLDSFSNEADGDDESLESLVGG